MIAQICRIVKPLQFGPRLPLAHIRTQFVWYRTDKIGISVFNPFGAGKWKRRRKRHATAH
jgi:hypothetical protein